MTRLLNLFCIGLLTAFLLGSVAQAASFGAMAAVMDTVHSEAMTACDGCDDMENGTGYVGDCVSLVLAVLPSIGIATDAKKVTEQENRRAVMPGRSDPPATSPPRSQFPN
ncbi:hypothetical protein [Aliiruegeria lutimaris]|uniref:Uncharacterized protein n=1 Tax=Aliiruegeria lutimaris TaxID=571298 RepID=A0A1G9MJV6_9RHOB|nr:hypothetical protein [Aliiruegeria lutimaris]SDL74281.1 hypothetical protein SAMN04488026_11115 [Aliiruegeria lutimaris]